MKRREALHSLGLGLLAEELRSILSAVPLHFGALLAKNYLLTLWLLAV